MAAADPELATALKAAKSKQMFFAFIPKGPADGKLIVSKTKIPAKDIAAAKKELGGGNPVTGKCSGPMSAMVFTTAKPAPGTLAAALKIVTKRDAGAPVIASFELGASADADEEDTGAAPGGAEAIGAAQAAAGVPEAAAAAGAQIGAAAGAAPKAPAGDPKITGIQKALQKLGIDPGPIDGVTGPKTQAAIKKFQQTHGLAADGIAGPKTQAALAKALAGGGAAAAGGAAPPAPPAPPAPAAPPAPPAAGAAAPNLGQWQAARQQAINGLKALAAKVAGTKHADAAGVVKEISGIIAKLPASPAPNAISQLEAFIMKDEGITAAEASPKHFHDLNIRKPLLAALDTLK